MQLISSAVLTSCSGAVVVAFMLVVPLEPLARFATRAPYNHRRLALPQQEVRVHARAAYREETSSAARKARKADREGEEGDVFV